MINDYTPGFQDYLNNITEKNPAVDRDYTIADFALYYAIGCARAELYRPGEAYTGLRKSICSR